MVVHPRLPCASPHLPLPPNTQSQEELEAQAAQLADQAVLAQAQQELLVALEEDSRMHLTATAAVAAAAQSAAGLQGAVLVSDPPASAVNAGDDAGTGVSPPEPADRPLSVAARLEAAAAGLASPGPASGPTGAAAGTTDAGDGSSDPPLAQAARPLSSAAPASLSQPQLQLAAAASALAELDARKSTRGGGLAAAAARAHANTPSAAQHVAYTAQLADLDAKQQELLRYTQMQHAQLAELRAQLDDQRREGSRAVAAALEAHRYAAYAYDEDAAAGGGVGGARGGLPSAAFASPGARYSVAPGRSALPSSQRPTPPGRSPQPSGYPHLRARSEEPGLAAAGRASMREAPAAAGADDDWEGGGYRSPDAPTPARSAVASRAPTATNPRNSVMPGFLKRLFGRGRVAVDVDPSSASGGGGGGWEERRSRLAHYAPSSRTIGAASTQASNYRSKSRGVVTPGGPGHAAAAPAAAPRDDVFYYQPPPGLVLKPAAAAPAPGSGARAAAPSAAMMPLGGGGARGAMPSLAATGQARAGLHSVAVPAAAFGPGASGGGGGPGVPRSAAPSVAPSRAAAGGPAPGLASMRYK